MYHKWQSYVEWFLRYGAWQTNFFVILDHFLHFYPLNNPKNQNFKNMKKPPGDIIALHMCTINKNIWSIVPEIWSMWQTEFFVILDHFLHFYPPNNPKNQNFEKIKKTPEDIIILNKCTINDNHMMYGSWDIKRDTEFFVILDHFLHFYPHDNPNNQYFEKINKTPGDIIILHKCTLNENHMMYGS